VPATPHRPFVAAVSVVGLALLAVFAIADGGRVLDEADGLMLMLAVAILVAELFPVEIPDGDGEVSFSTTFAFALLLTDGVAAVVIVHGIALALAEALRRRPLERLVFNVAQYAICWAIAGGLLVAMTGELPDQNGLQYLELAHLPALVVAAAVFLALNTALADTPAALSRGVSPWMAIRGDLLQNAWWTVVLVALVPGILVAADYSLWLLPLIGIPLVAIQLGSRQAVINEHEARHDRVTGLSNREDVARLLERALHRAGRQGWQVGVLMIGLDRFKEINETLGHRRGDLVLAEVAKRLSNVAGPRDAAARLGGDEFALILGRVGGVEECVAVAERALATLAVPVMIRGVELDVGATAGIACHPEHGSTFDALLRHADVARSRAIAAHRPVVVYSADFDEHGVERLTLVSELGSAIDADQLELVFQPQVELETGRLRAVEALVRWPHPERGELSPEAFIEPAEHTGVIRRLTLWVIQSALAQSERWRAAGLDLRVAVNLSVRSITPDLPRDLAIILEGHDPAKLELEITETVGMVDAEGSLAVLEQLTALGVRLSVDDFGTGFSSLAYLKQLPVSAIKIDRSFVMEMDSEASDRAIVRSTVDLARHLGMEVVAEGVESEASMAELRALGCHLAQGFAISPPLGAEALAAWAAHGRPADAASGAA